MNCNLFKSLPDDIFNIISDYLTIDDIIYLHRTDKCLLSITNRPNIYNYLSLKYNSTESENFKDFLKLYSIKYINKNSPLYLSLDNCLIKCGIDGNTKLAIFFKQKGAKNFIDMMLGACQSGNIEGLDLSLKFIKDSKTIITDGNKITAIKLAAKYGHVGIIKHFEKTRPCIDYKKALITAAKYGQIEMYNHLNSKTYDSTQALIAAIKNSQTEMAKIIYTKIYKDAPHEDIINTLIESNNFELFKWIIKSVMIKI